MNGLRYAWVMAVVSLCGIVATPVQAGVTKTGDTKDESSYFYAGYNANTIGGLTIDAGSVFSRSYGYLGCAAGSTGTAIVTGAGSQWTNFGELHVGFLGSGTLRVEAGGQVGSYDGRLGRGPGSTGAAIVTGTGSTWTSYQLNVGYSGSGTLQVEDGGQISNTIGYLGYDPGSTGTAVVTGTGSTWINSRDLYVGYNGIGSLTVSDGGLVSAQTLHASLSDLHGDGTITASGVVLDADLSFDASHGLTQTLAFGSGGSLQLTIDGTGSLGVGLKHSGSLRIADGRSVASSFGYVGRYSSSTGTAVISGTGSTWTNSWDLYVGYAGTGMLRVESGGQVSNRVGYLGSYSTGTAIITGAGSKWITSDGLHVGFHGSGSLRVEAGGEVSDSSGYLGPSGSTATITGTGSKWINSYGLSVASGTLRVEDGGQVSSRYGYLAQSSGSTGTATITGAGSKWINSSSLYVGDSGSGTLRVEDGGQVSSDSATLGFQSGSTGTVVVTGVGSNWTNSGDLSAGYSGSGTLTVEAGGQVSSIGGYLGYNSGSTGTATITGAGSKWTSSQLYVGYSGSGTLRVEDGGQVSSGSGHLGYNSDSTGTATITGAGSKWTNFGNLYIGNKGGGTLRVEAGGQVRSTNAYLGYGSGSTGTAIITGTGSTWINSGDLHVGYSGSGSLTVSHGGLVSAKTLYASLSDLHGDGTITASGVVLDADLSFDATHDLTQTLAFSSGGTLQLTVDGTGSLGVGYKGSGSLRIAGGRSVASTVGYLGYYFGSTGTAIVTGAGSTWTNSGNLYVGPTAYYGRGTLTVSDGGQVTAKSMSINNYSTVCLHVSGDRMLVLGDASTVGSIDGGELYLLADAFLPAGTYQPVAEYSGRTLTWSRIASPFVVGGTWDRTAQTFTVLSPKPVNAGTPATVSSGLRLLITDPATGERAGISFGALGASTPLTSRLLTQPEQAILRPLLTGDEEILSAWRFSGQLSGDHALFSVDVGMGAQGLHLWRLYQNRWIPYTPGMLTYDSNGIVSFTIDPPSLNAAGYVVSGIVPEPATLSLLALTATSLLRRRPPARR